MCVDRGRDFRFRQRVELIEKKIAVFVSLRRRRSARNSWPTLPLAMRMLCASVTSVSGTRVKKRGRVKSARGELASGCRSMLFGVKTISGLRHGRRACRRSK